MIKLPKKNINIINYSESLARKTDYVIIVNDSDSSNVSDLYIIWNQKTKVFISSEISDLRTFLYENKISTKHNILIIGTENIKYLELEKYAFFLEIYLKIREEKNNKKYLNEVLDIIYTYYFIINNNNVNERLLKCIKALINNDYDNYCKNYNYLINLNNPEILLTLNKILCIRQRLNNKYDIKYLKIYSVYPLYLSLILNIKNIKIINKIMEIYDNLEKVLRLKNDILNIENLEDYKIINKHNSLYINEYKNEKDIDKNLKKSEIKEIKHRILTTVAYQISVDNLKECWNQIYSMINSSKILSAKDKKNLIALTVILEIMN